MAGAFARRLFRWGTSAIAALAISDACADDATAFSFGGFGTIGVAQSRIPNGDFVSNLFQSAGTGLSHGADMAVDSKLGGQLDATFTRKLSGVLQVVAASRNDNRSIPRVEWANLKYHAAPNLEARIGRIALPNFMLSDTRLVGFSNPWIRPPVETYSLNPITNSDGADMSYRVRFGDLHSTSQLWFGSTRLDIVRQSGDIIREVKVRRLHGFANTLEWNAFTWRLSASKADFEVPLAGGPVKFPVSNFNVGVVYDSGPLLVQSEVSRMNFGMLARNQKAFYLTVGYQWFEFKPYITYSTVWPDDGPANLTSRDQQSVSAGVRKELAKDIAFKFQIDHIRLADGNQGFFVNAQPGLAGSRGNVASAAIDFLF